MRMHLRFYLRGKCGQEGVGTLTFLIFEGCYMRSFQLHSTLRLLAIILEQTSLFVNKTLIILMLFNTLCIFPKRLQITEL
jgi:hypothetical protein